LKRTDPMAKTIVFCNDIDHAERMRRALANCNPEQMAKNEKYVMKITGDDEIGKAQLDNFINPKRPYPVIATTSELMTTGVDAKTCKLVVLDSTIKSMTKFKQIIGRGTRIDDRFGKLWFSILDFKKATELFADERFDGTPERVKVTKPEDFENEDGLNDIVDGTDEADNADSPFGDDVDPDTITEPTPPPYTPNAGDVPPQTGDDPVQEEVRKFHVSGVTVTKIAERVQYYDSDGKLVTESFKDYTRKAMTKEFKSLDEFTRKWNESDRKQAIIDELAEIGIIWEALEQEVGKDMDPFDMICHVVYDQPPLTRRERADKVRKRNYFTKYSETAQVVLSSLLDKYADEGVLEIENKNVLKVAPFTDIGRPIEIVKKGFGKPADYDAAISELESAIYQTA
ncbi:MAG: DEAD/DEAH box helicase, partial [Shewanella sp.]|nr:DEAD/DEAH box helicase [Shewanella sp.]